VEARCNTSPGSESFGRFGAYCPSHPGLNVGRKVPRWRFGLVSGVSGVRRAAHGAIAPGPAGSRTDRTGPVRITDILTGERIHGRDVASRFNRPHPRIAAKSDRKTFRDHPFDEFCARKLSELIDYLGAVGPDMEASGDVYWRELQLFGMGPQAKVRMVEVWADWPDYAPYKDREPNLHFRLEVHGDDRLIGEARAGTLAEAEGVIRQAFGQ